jgi:putative ABC transport system permease protein
MREARKILVEMGFSVSALSDTVEQANKIFRAIQIILGFFGVIALIVATIGLINTMTISLLERTNEIGIMQALGASPQDVKKIFLAESLVIGFLGGVGGIFLGIFGAEVFNWGLNILAKSLGGQAVELFYYPLWFLLFIIFLSLFVGLIGGLWPAQRAAKLNPLEALRYK